jgi:hypothetical protein
MATKSSAIAAIVSGTNTPVAAMAAVAANTALLMFVSGMAVS